jgi:hypothetical protein
MSKVWRPGAIKNEKLKMKNEEKSFEINDFRPLTFDCFACA